MTLFRKLPLAFLLLASLLMLFVSCEDLLDAAKGDDEEGPATPSNFVAVLGSGDYIEMSWTDNSDNENGFRIEVNMEGSIVWNQIADLNRNTTSYAWDGHSENNAYTFRIYAYNDINDSPTITSGQVIVPLVAPTEFSGTFNGTAVELTWVDNSNAEAGYRIERMNNNGPWVIMFNVDANETSFNDTSPPTGQNVYYRIFAYSGSLTSPLSNEISVLVPEFLSAPGNLLAQVSGDQINITWEDNSSLELGFLLERKVDDGNFEQIADLGANVTNYVDNNFPGDADLTYRAYAWNNSDVSVPSNESTVHSPAGEVTVAFEDDFESYSYGDFPGSPWTFSTSNESFVYAYVDEDDDGDNFLVFADDDAAEYGWVDVDLPTVSEGALGVDLGVIDDYITDGFGLMLGSTDMIQGESDIAAYVEFISDNTDGASVFVWNGTDWESYSFPTYEWYRFVFAWVSGESYRVFLNGTQLGGTYPFYNGVSSSTVSSMSVALFNNMQLYYGFMDNVMMTNGIPSQLQNAEPIQRGPVATSTSKVTAQSMLQNSKAVAPSRKLSSMNAR